MNKIEELKNLKEIWNNEHKKYTEDYIEFGDYTYGNPIILSWNNECKLKIGKFCSFAEGVTILLGGEHRSDWVSTYPFNCLLKSFNNITGHPKSKGNIVIGNDVWIASGVKILSGVTIGNGAIVGANTLVSKDVPAYSIVGGNPMKIIKYRFDENIIHQLEEIQWWNLDEKHIVKIIPLLQSNNIKKLIKYCTKKI